MKGVILAAGEGLRLNDAARPKVLSLVGGEPLLSRQVRYLREHGVDEIRVTMLDRWAGEVADLARDLGVGVSFEEHPHGTSGSLYRAAPFDQPYVVLLGDIVTNLDIGALIYRLRSADAAISVYQTAGIHEKGVVDANHDGRIRSFVEKPLDRFGVAWCAAGVYAFRPVMTRLCEHEWDLGRDVFPLALAQRLQLVAVPTSCPVIGIDTELRLRAANMMVEIGDL